MDWQMEQEDRRKLAEAKLKEEEERLLREAAHTPRLVGSVISTPGFGRRYNQTPLNASEESSSAPTPLNTTSAKRTPRRVGL